MIDVYEQSGVPALYIMGDGEKTPFHLIDWSNMEYFDRLKIVPMSQNRVMRISATSEAGRVRTYLLSKAGGRNIVTMCGYNKINGPIALRSSSPSETEEVERSGQETLQFLKSIDLIHVAVAENTKSCDVRRIFGALKVHRNRTQGLDLEEISLNDAANFYRRMAGSCPF